MSTSLYALEDLLIGDVILLVANTTAGFVRKSTPELLEDIEVAIGIVRDDCAAGDEPKLYRPLVGTVPRAITGLPAEEGYARIGADGRAEWVASFAAGDHPLGLVSADGDLRFDPRGPVPEAGVSSIQSSDTISANVVGGVSTPAVSEVFTGARYVPPASAGTDMRAAIMAALATGACLLAPGRVYEVTSPGISVADQQRLECEGLAIIRAHASWTPASNQADVSTNCVVRVEGAITGTVNTTLTALAMSAVAQVEVAVRDDITPGMVLELEGPSAGDGAPDMSDSADVRIGELVQVADDYVPATGPGVVTLNAPMQQWHKATTTTVKSVAAATGAKIRGIAVDCAGRTFATGIRVARALDVVLEEVTFTGFSRACIDAQPGSTGRVEGFYSRGEVNAGFFGNSAIGWEISRVRTAKNGKRAHANGTPRGFFTFWQRCTDISVSDVIVQHVHCAWWHQGGWDLRCDDFTFRDIDLDARHSRDSTVTESGLAAAIDMGGAPLTAVANAWGGFDSYGAEFARGVHFGSGKVSEVFGSHAELDWAWHLHDTYQFTGDMQMSHAGPASGTPVGLRTLYWNGVKTNDVGGAIDTMNCVGVSRGLWCTGGPYIDINFFRFNGSCGGGSQVIAIMYHSGGAPRIRNGHQENGGGIFFGAEAVASPDYSTRFDKFTHGGVGSWTNIVLARNVSGAPQVTAGTSLEQVAGGTRDVDVAAAQSRKVMVNTGLCAANVNNGPLLVAPLPATQSMCRVAGAGDAGADLEADGSGTFVVNATPVAPAARLAATKASGTGLAECYPPIPGASGAAPYFPGTLGNLVLALDAREVTPSGGLVASWPDLSAAPFVVSQGTGGLQPDYIADAGDGMPSVDFTGTEYLEGTGVPVGQSAGDYTVAALVKADVDGYYFSVFGSGLRLAAGMRAVEGGGAATAVHRIFDNAGGDGELSTGAVLPVGWHLIIARRATTSQQLRVDGTNETPISAPGGALTLTGFTVGAWLGATSFFDGEVAGIWAWDEHLDDAACADFEAWLQSERPICP